jgi:single-stranded-DNA-specific exonuclease
LGNQIRSGTWIVDWRNGIGDRDDSTLVLNNYPRDWDDLQVSCYKAIQAQKKLAIAYPPPQNISPNIIWQQLVGIAKYLSRTGEIATTQALRNKLNLTSSTLDLGLQSLIDFGFQIEFLTSESFRIELKSPLSQSLPNSAFTFISAVEEEYFCQNYFHVVPLSTLESMIETSRMPLSDRLSPTS